MHDLQWYDYLRIMIMVLDIYCLYTSGRRFFKYGQNYTKRLAQLWWVLNAFLILQLEGTLEQVVLNLPDGPRTIISFFVALICAIALNRDEGYIKSEPTFKHKDS